MGLIARAEAMAHEMERAAELDKRDPDRRVTHFDASRWAEEVRALADLHRGAVEERDELRVSLTKLQAQYDELAEGIGRIHDAMGLRDIGGQ